MSVKQSVQGRAEAKRGTSFLSVMLGILSVAVIGVAIFYGFNPLSQRTGEPSSNEEVPVAEVQVPTSTEVVPTPTNTPEPTPTEVVEVPSVNQEALLNEVFPMVREAGCEPTYEVAYYPEFANSIPWTVDANGNIVQGLTELNFCGAAAESGVVEGPILALADVAKNPILSQATIGPNFGRGYVAFELPTAMPERYVGFLNTADMAELESLLLCMQQGNDRPDAVLSLLIPTNKAVLQEFGMLYLVTLAAPIQSC